MCEMGPIWLLWHFHAKVGFLSLKMVTRSSLITENHVILTASSTCLYAIGTQTVVMDQVVTWYIGAKMQTDATGDKLLPAPCKPSLPAAGFSHMAKCATLQPTQTTTSKTKTWPRCCKSAISHKGPSARACHKLKTERKNTCTFGSRNVQTTILSIISKSSSYKNC